MKYLFSLLLFFIFIIGCSTFSSMNVDDKKLKERHNKILKEDFKVGDKVLEKFEENTSSPLEEESDIKQNLATKKEIKLKPKKRTEIKTKPIKLKKKPGVLRKKIELKSNYPKEFPSKFITYDKESEKYWNRFKPHFVEGEKIQLHISYMGVSTGKITVETKKSVKVGEFDSHHVHARIKTADFYSYLYSIDDICDSYIRKDNFTPLKFSLIQRESSQDIDDLQLFDHAENKTYSLYKRVTKEKTRKKKKVEFVPHKFQDPLSVLYFIRGLPMDKTKYTIPIVNQGKVEILTAKFSKIETLETKVGEMDAYKVDVSTKHKGKTIEGGKMTFWFSTDEKRIFLKFIAKIKIGSISGEIDSYER